MKKTLKMGLLAFLLHLCPLKAFCVDGTALLHDAASESEIVSWAQVLEGSSYSMESFVFGKDELRVVENYFSTGRYHSAIYVFLKAKTRWTLVQFRANPTEVSYDFNKKSGVLAIKNAAGEVVFSIDLKVSGDAHGN